LTILNPYRMALAALSLLFVAACGDGGGTSAPTAQLSTSPADQTGVVGILIKDAPSDDFTRILMRMTRVELLGNGDPRTVFNGDREFDLLALRHHANLLSLSDGVAVGNYDKIRLRVSRITLHYLDNTGTEVSRNVRVPANGKIDLNPRGTFTVAADTALLIQIDLDAKKSIHVVGTGNDDFRFRPVVFVDIDERAIPEGLLRVSGEVDAIDDDGFELCRPEGVLVDSLTNGCILVNTSDATAYFDADGQPIDPEGLISGETLTVFAEVIAVPLEDMDADDDLDDDDTIALIQLSAFVVHQGSPSNLLSLDGAAVSVVDGDGQFDFQLDAGQELQEEAPISVQLQDNTRILSGDDLSELTPDAIDEGVLAGVSGVVLPGIPEDPTHLSAALIVIEGLAPVEGLTELEGSVVSLDTETFSLFAENEAPPGDRCIAPLPDARYLTVMDSDEGADHSEVDADYLAAGQAVTAFGVYADSGDCFQADTIIIDETGSED